MQTTIWGDIYGVGMTAHECASSSKENSFVFLFSFQNFCVDTYLCKFYLVFRKAGGGSITPHVQNFLLEICTGTKVNDYYFFLSCKIYSTNTKMYIFCIREEIHNLFEKKLV